MLFSHLFALIELDSDEKENNEAYTAPINLPETFFLPIAQIKSLDKEIKITKERLELLTEHRNNSITMLLDNSDPEEMQRMFDYLKSKMENSNK